jgi:hypothetical protein
LRAEHKAAFDRLFTRARAHSAEAANTARPVPFDAIVMAILLEQEIELERLKEEIQDLKADLKNKVAGASCPRPATLNISHEP